MRVGGGKRFLPPGAPRKVILVYRGGDLKTRIVDTDDGFDALEESWNRLTDGRKSSFFSTYDYVRTAWNHLRRPTDRLLLMVLENGSSVRGIAPFYVRRQRIRGIPVRKIRFIAAWEGDRPCIVASGSEEAAWREILSFLDAEFREWEILELAEQPEEGPEGNGWPFRERRGWYWECEPGGVDPYVSLAGSWEEYLQRLGYSTRGHWRRRCRRLSESPGGYAVEWISDRERMPETLSRFIALERSGWKAEAGIGAGKDVTHRSFYEDLLRLAASKGKVLAGFLKSGGEDVAAVINFLHQEVIYLRHTTYSQAHEKFAPGILLQAEVIRYGFGGPWKEYDLLTMDGREAPRSKFEWANGLRKTVDWKGYRTFGRLLPLVAAKRLKRRFGKDAPHPPAGD